MILVSTFNRKIFYSPCILLLLFIISMFFSGCHTKPSGKNELDGIYRATSHDPNIKQFVLQEDIYLKIENNNIIYHSTINKQPKYHIKGSFKTKDRKTLSVTWESGKLPPTLYVKDSSGSKVIEIGNSLYIK